MSTSVLNIQNPFLKSNPFFKPQKFHSQDKIATLPFDSEFLPDASHNYSHSLAGSIKAPQYKPVANQSYGSLKHTSDENSAFSMLSHSSKDRNIPKKCINMKDNPFLRKNLMPFVCEEPLQEDQKWVNNARDKTKIMFGNSAIGKRGTKVDNFLVSSALNVSSVKPLKSQKQQNKQSSREAASGERNGSESRGEERPKNYLSSELKIKLKSQTLIEEEKLSLQQQTIKGEKSVKSRRQQYEQFPRVMEMRGKKFYLQEVQYNF